MPSSKRKPRRKAADMNEAADLELPGSSPTRPSAKKRKVNGGRSSTRRKSPSPDPLPAHPFEDSGDESETVSQSDLIDSVISYLGVSKEPVTASTEHANEKEQPENMQKVSAYAKIAGRDWTFFVRDQSVNIGRPPDGGKDTNGTALGASSPIADMKEMLPVHIDLGPSKIVSRHHASIYYDSEFPEGGGWHVRVNGRNGVKVNNVLLKRGGRQQIQSGAILEISGTQMMFVTPGDKAQIDQSFIDRAKALATGEEFGPPSHSHPDASETNAFSANAYGAPGSYQSLAPAPPNFKRATTPPPHQKDGRGVFDSKPTQSPMYNRGMVMESTHEIDYARDGAKDLKPPFSYAMMIAQAIFSSEEEKLTLSNIYAYISEKFAFYRHSRTGWQNSIRHNLSLNKAFQKVPRRTDEPGKGMKWQIAPEYRQEYWKKQNRRGVNSSAPSSPASGKEVNPNFRGPNGQNLGYDTTMVSSFSAKDMTDRPVPPHPARMNFQPFSSGQQTIPPPPNLEATTPQRRRTDTQTTAPDMDMDDSPLPHGHHSGHPTPGNSLPVYTLPSSVPPPHRSPTNPTLSSSYLDTPFHSNAHSNHLSSSILTPAPLRQNPRLAPPSTLVAPSKFMPESSPVGPAGLFWRGAMMANFTPGMAVPDMSPVKDDRGLERGVMSSSPPPMDGMGSPTKSRMGRSSQPPPSSAIKSSFVKEEQDKSNGTLEDRENGEANKMGERSLSEGHAPALAPPMQTQQPTKDEDDEDDGIGFDLARGFAPIGAARSFSGSQHGAAAARAS